MLERIIPSYIYTKVFRGGDYLLLKPTFGATRLPDKNWDTIWVTVDGVKQQLTQIGPRRKVVRTRGSAAKIEITNLTRKPLWRGVVNVTGPSVLKIEFGPTSNWIEVSLNGTLLVEGGEGSAVPPS